MVPDYTAPSVCLKRQGSFIWLEKNTVPRLSEYNDGMSL
jgi:hypothetical protein